MTYGAEVFKCPDTTPELHFNVGAVLRHEAAAGSHRDLQSKLAQVLPRIKVSKRALLPHAAMRHGVGLFSAGPALSQVVKRSVRVNLHSI